MDGFKSTKSYKINTADGHQLYVEESGERTGIPALFLHGGPGAGIGRHYQWPFAAHDYHLIAFDQRGCGQSQPFGELNANNTQTLIDDIERIREFFGINEWLIFGGSWGATLALCYAIKYPQRVSAMVLRGIFLAREVDTDWFISPNNGAAVVYPKHYKTFVKNINSTHAQTMVKEFYALLSHADESIRNDAAKRWFNWEGNISKLDLEEQDASDYATQQQINTLALMECYFLLNKCFIENNYILNNADKIAHIPTHIIHGRDDKVCNAEAAISLHAHLPSSTLNLVENAGHSMNEKGISKALMESVEYFAHQLSGKV